MSLGNWTAHETQDPVKGDKGIIIGEVENTHGLETTQTNTQMSKNVKYIIPNHCVATCGESVPG